MLSKSDRAFVAWNKLCLVFEVIYDQTLKASDDSAENSDHKEYHKSFERSSRRHFVVASDAINGHSVTSCL
jgi:hypothetical protein